MVDGRQSRYVKRLSIQGVKISIYIDPLIKEIVNQMVALHNAIALLNFMKGVDNVQRLAVRWSKALASTVQ
jgi:hypothetical protein